jgi:hypothetical protein
LVVQSNRFFRPVGGHTGDAAGRIVPPVVYRRVLPDILLSFFELSYPNQRTSSDEDMVIKINQPTNGSPSFTF